MDQSAEDLRQKFSDLLEQDFEDPSRRWLAVWNLFAGRPWYDGQLRGCAHYVLKQSGLPADLEHDIKQGAWLLLGRSLQRAPNLHIDPRRAETHFEPWLRTIIMRDCRQAVRSLTSGKVAAAVLSEDIADDTSPNRHFELAEAFHKAVQRLTPRQQAVVLLVGKGMPWSEIAERTGVSERQVRRDYEKGIERLRRFLDDDFLK